MLDLRKLHTFRVAAATRSFTRAAAELGCCQSSVTVHIRALEDELGVPLFERCRSSKTVVLTAIGRRVLDYAGRLLALAEETKAAVSLASVGRDGGASVSSGN
jgi:DNA-binding transcriptional LysR family regulator